MSMGMQIWDSGGNLLVDTDNYLLKKEGTFWVGNNFNGYVDFPNIDPNLHTLRGNLGFEYGINISGYYRLLLVYQIENGRIRVQTGPTGGQTVEVWRI